MTLFNTDQTPPAIDENADYLTELVGEGKKFKDAADLAKGKAMADAFIEQLKQEQAELRKDYLSLREEYQARPALQELLDQFKTVQQTSNEPPLVNDVQTPASMKPEEIESLVSKKLSEIETTRKQEENLRSVEAKLKERFGDNYQTHFKNQISTLGLTEDFVTELARNHPVVLFKTLGLDQVQQSNSFQTPPRSQQTSFAPTNVKRDWSYYETMRKTKSADYWNPKTQLQMMQDKMTLGDAFGNPAP